MKRTEKGKERGREKKNMSKQTNDILFSTTIFPWKNAFLNDIVNFSAYTHASGAGAEWVWVRKAGVRSEWVSVSRLE